MTRFLPLLMTALMASQLAHASPTEGFTETLSAKAKTQIGLIRAVLTLDAKYALDQLQNFKKSKDFKNCAKKDKNCDRAISLLSDLPMNEPGVVARREKAINDGDNEFTAWVATLSGQEAALAKKVYGAVTLTYLGLGTLNGLYMTNFAEDTVKHCGSQPTSQTLVCVADQLERFADSSRTDSYEKDFLVEARAMVDELEKAIDEEVGAFKSSVSL